MLKQNTVLKCADCGFVTEVVAECKCETCAITCCGKPMAVLEEKTADSKGEKHVPFPMDNGKGGTKVVVGENMAHPMLSEHYIVWIEIQNGPYVNRKYLKPGEEPSAEFYVSLQKGMIVREYCNLHGLWKYEVK